MRDGSHRCQEVRRDLTRTPDRRSVAAMAQAQVSAPAVRVRGLRRRYGDREVVRGIDLDVARGEIFAFLGPNGAGKTTTVEILEGFRRRSGGEVEVLGADPDHFSRADRGRFGCVLQSGELEPHLTPRELLTLWASYYDEPRAVDEMLDLVGLTAQGGVRIERLSGGQRRRVEMGLALIGRPELVFLDEPTTGFDPEARRAAWDVIAGLRDLGATIFLTTHYLEEAQRLADRVAVIRDGTIIATGRPDELGAQDRVHVSFRLPVGSWAELPPVPGAVVDGRNVTLSTERPTEALALWCAWAAAQGIELDELSVRRPSLEDVYLELLEQP